MDVADLHLAILAVLAGHPRTGLGTMQALLARDGASATTSGADVDCSLLLLEEKGLLAGRRDEAGRFVYALTDDGTAVLVAQRRLPDAAGAARDTAVFSGLRHRPRCCRRTAAAIAASLARHPPRNERSGATEDRSATAGQ